MYLVEGSTHGFTSIPQSIDWTIRGCGAGDHAADSAFCRLCGTRL